MRGVCQCRMYFFSLKNCTRRLCRTGASFLAFHLAGRGQVQTSDVNTTFCMHPSDAMPLQRILHVSVEYFMYPSNLILHLSVESAVFARTCSAELDLRHGSSMSIPRNPRRPSCAACGSGIVIHDTCRWSSHPIILVSPPGATRAHLFTLSYTKCAYPSAPFSIPPRASKCFNRTSRIISHTITSHTHTSECFSLKSDKCACVVWGGVLIFQCLRLTVFKSRRTGKSRCSFLNMGLT